MTFAPYDPSTSLGRVRMLLSDTDPSRPILQDEEIAAFLDMGNNAVMLAAAFALDSIATNEVLCTKVVTILGLQTDGAAVAKALSARALQLRDDYAKYENDDPLFGTAEFADGVFQAAEEVAKQYIRNGGY